MTHVVDASVACKWYLTEDLSAKAWDLANSEEDMLAPDFLLVECANVAWKRVLKGSISFEQARGFTRALPNWFTSLTPAQELYKSALEIACVLEHSVYDCMYVALAQRESAVLVTADQRLVAQVQQSDWAHLIRALD